MRCWNNKIKIWQITVTQQWKPMSVLQVELLNKYFDVSGNKSTTNSSAPWRSLIFAQQKPWKILNSTWVWWWNLIIYSAHFIAAAIGNNVNLHDNSKHTKLSASIEESFNPFPRKYSCDTISLFSCVHYMQSTHPGILLCNNNVKDSDMKIDREEEASKDIERLKTEEMICG